MGKGTANSQCPLGSLHYSSCVLNTRVLVKIITELVLSLDVSSTHVAKVEWALFILAYPLVRHRHPLLFICHMSPLSCVIINILKDHMIKVSYKSSPFALALFSILTQH